MIFFNKVSSIDVEIMFIKVFQNKVYIKYKCKLINQ